MFEDARSDNGRLEELRAAVRVLHGRAHGDASAANVFLQQLQQQQQCVWLCSEGLREGYDPLVGFAMASMLRHALLRFIAEYTDEDKHKLFARVSRTEGRSIATSYQLNTMLHICATLLLRIAYTLTNPFIH
jgi:hypothetical protein